MKLVLIRHCETDWNTKENKLRGHTDIPLNNNGRSHAKILGDKLKEFGISIVVSSDLTKFIKRLVVTRARKIMISRNSAEKAGQKFWRGKSHCLMKWQKNTLNRSL